MDKIRKIIHIDMDAFYASVEQRDNKCFRGKSVIVGGDPSKRGVVATCSYEARKYGVHSAMASMTAYKLCPNAIFVTPRMEVYKSVSNEIMDIFHDYSDIIEPLSLDEAFIDVTENKVNNSSATIIAKEIKKRIYNEVGITASAGVSFNKFLAKIASDYKKPNGLTVIEPKNVGLFLDKLGIEKFFGVGKVTKNRLNNMGIFKGEDIKKFTESELISLFKDKGKLLYDFSRGIDNRSVNPSRKRKSIGNETTLREDIEDIDEMINILDQLSDKIEKRLKQSNISGKTITLKVKFSDFKNLTRRITVKGEIKDKNNIMLYAGELLKEIPMDNKKVRLLGITISNLDKDNFNNNEYSQLNFKDSI